MQQSIKQLLPQSFLPNAKVWIYQSSRPFQEQEILEINEQLLQFYSQWQSHHELVEGWAKVLFDTFIVVMANEEESATVSGCSTDSMVRVIKSIERQYKVNMFDRMTLTFLVKDKPEMLPMQQVSYALEKGYLETDTPLFNNLVATKQQLETEWLVPLNKSWLWSRIVNNL